VPLSIVAITVDATYDLRRRLLRTGTPSTDPSFPGDDAPGVRHYGALDDNTSALVGVVTSMPKATPWRDGAVAVQLRGMAVEPDRQGQGIGRALLDALVTDARHAGASVVWANARVSALTFYTAAGMVAVGEVFVPTETALAHRLVLLDL